MVQVVDVTWQLVGEIEALRQKRREEWRGRRHPELKRFTQEDICLGPCPTYRNLLTRRSKRLPSRAVVQEIADYLECSLAERNDLLICAGYLPESMAPTDGRLAQALERLRATLHGLGLPAYILASDWTIYDTNAAFKQLWNGADLLDYPLEQRTLIHLIFDPTLPFRARVGTERRRWEWHAQTSAAMFKQRVKLRRYDRAVRRQIENCLLLPQFAEKWQVEASNEADMLSDTFECLGGAEGTLQRVRYLGLSLYGAEYPQICVYLPADKETQQALPLWPTNSGDSAALLLADILRVR